MVIFLLNTSLFYWFHTKLCSILIVHIVIMRFTNFSTYIDIDIDIHGVCVYYIHVLNTIFSKLLHYNNAKKIVNSDAAENIL